MHRIDTPTAQKDKFGAGKNGFTRGNPQTGTPATDLDNDYFDMLQEELAGVVEATGVILDKSKHNQLLTALRKINMENYSSGTGWRRTPDGFIEQWGVSTAANSSGIATITFPIPFPNSCETLQLTEGTSLTSPRSGVLSWGVDWGTLTKTGVSIISSDGVETCRFRALGR